MSTTHLNLAVQIRVTNLILFVGGGGGFWLVGCLVGWLVGFCCCCFVCLFICLFCFFKTGILSVTSLNVLELIL